METLHPHRRLFLELAAEFGALAGLRTRLRRWLQDLAVTAEAQDELLLVATEMCANAIEATPPTVPIEVLASHDGRALRLVVSNVQASVDDDLPAPELRPGSLQERGRGLAIVRSLVDTFSMSSVDGRTVVRAMRLL